MSSERSSFFRNGKLHGVFYVFVRFEWFRLLSIKLVHGFVLISGVVESRLGRLTISFVGLP